MYVHVLYVKKRELVHFLFVICVDFFKKNLHCLHCAYLKHLNNNIGNALLYSVLRVSASKILADHALCKTQSR